MCITYTIYIFIDSLMRLIINKKSTEIPLLKLIDYVKGVLNVINEQNEINAVQETCKFFIR